MGRRVHILNGMAHYMVYIYVCRFTIVNNYMSNGFIKREANLLTVKPGSVCLVWHVPGEPFDLASDFFVGVLLNRGVKSV
jgi:hypothetical protein